MEVGLALPQFDGFSLPGGRRVEWTDVAAWASRAEALGFHSVWLADHLIWSIDGYGGPPDARFGFDPLMGLAGLAQSTSRIGLGTLVLAAGMRPPAVTARQAETVAALAPRRLQLGLGAGWYEPEYAAAGLPFGSPGERLRQLEDTLRAVRDHLGDGAPTLWVGGKGDRLLRVTARWADGWNAGFRHDLDSFAERSGALDDACAAVGREPEEVSRSVARYVHVGESAADLKRRFDRLRAASPPGTLPASVAEARSQRMVGTIAEVAEQVAAWRERGARLLIACLGAVPFSVSFADDLDLLASALLNRE